MDRKSSYLAFEMEENGSQPRKLCCTQCDGSDKKGATAAAGSCAECSRFLCKSCLPGHGTSFPHHSVFPLPPQGGYSQPLTNQICRYHKATPLSFYCNNCDRPICFKCAAEHHWKHQCVQSDQAAIAERASLATSLALAKHKSQEFAKARTSVSGMVRAVQDCYKKTLLDIYEAGNDYKKAIDQRVRALEEELTMGYYAQQLSLAKTREEFDGQLSVIQHREALFQHVLQSGSNVELLSHKKEISTQVEQLEAMKPHTCFKEDRFLKFSVADKSKVEDFLVENFGNLKACHLADHLSADATSQDLKPARSESSISSEHVISRDIEVSSDIPHVTSAGGDAPRSNADDFIPGGITMSTARPTEEVVRETKSDSEILGNGVAMATQVSPQVWGYRGGGGKVTSSVWHPQSAPDLSQLFTGAPTTTGPVWSHGGTQSGFSGGSNASLSAWEHAVNAQQVAATGRSGGGFSPSMPTGVASALKQILDDSDEAAEDEDITFTYAPYPTPPHPTQQVWRPNQQYYEDDMARHKVAIDLKFGKWGDMEGYFRKPSGISVDSRGQLHVVDVDNSRVQIFDSEGNFLRVLQPQDEEADRLQAPCCIHVSQYDRYYYHLPSFRSSMYRSFHPSFLFLSSFLPRHRKCCLLCFYYQYIGRLDRSIECPHLKSPNGLALTSDGVIVVSDFWSPGAVLLSHDGRYLGQVGNVPSCRHPISVAVIPSPDRILIGDVTGSKGHPSPLHLTLFSVQGDPLAGIETMTPHPLVRGLILTQGGHALFTDCALHVVVRFDYLKIFGEERYLQ
ncbi:protein wech-like [Branchiostoma floridae]|uniref:Protein wech-like n=1 Tax=Branchiostoma floridae TaxID=7739 RepID=A0A9J7LNZ2_BRAFL|nr:protein wech-like [Branchiostoma floridae]